MARTDNLNNFLTDVANSIRAKKGTTDTILASNFDTEISSIETGSTPVLQSKSITITENGTQNISYDEGYDGLSNVEITTNIKQTSNFQTKSITITKNGTQTITPDDSYDALSRVDISVNVSEGGGSTISSVKYEPMNVNFIDYDGTPLYSYTLGEIKTLTELPTLPNKNGSVAKMWNWTLDEIIEKNEPVDVGAIYDVENTLELKVNINEYMCDKTTYVNVSRYLNTEVLNYSIDWGDGSDIETGSVSSNPSLKHIYTKSGSYIIKINVLDSETQKITPSTYNSSSYPHSLLFSRFASGSFSSGSYRNATLWWNAVEEISIGYNVNFPAQLLSYQYSNMKYVKISDIEFALMYNAFNTCQCLKSLVVPRAVKLGSKTTAPSAQFINCRALETVSFPKEVSSMAFAASTFSGCYSLKKFIIPEGFTSIGGSAFRFCYNLEYISIPDTVTTIGTYTFADCMNLKQIRMSNSLTSIPDYCFQNCYSLEKIDLPNTITSIGNNAFNSATNSFGFPTCTFDFSNFTSIPTVTTSSFNTSSNTNLKIIVPDDLYDTWITTSNWSTYINYIIKTSEV